MRPIVLRYFRVILVSSVMWLGYEALGQEFVSETAPVCEIKIEGNKQVSEGFIRQQIRNVKLKQPLKREELQRDVDNLKLTGKFSEIYATTQLYNGNLLLTIHVVERPAIQAVRFQGATKIKVKDLESQLTFKVGDPLDAQKALAGAEVLAQKYRDEGFNEASVTLDEKQLEQGVIVYNITEGPKVKITKIKFEGQQTFSERQLIGQIQTKTYVWILRPGTYSESQVQEDIVSLRNFYRKNGFLDAQVGRELEYSPERDKLTVTFVISEGPQYTICNINVEGNRHFTTQQILDAMQLTPNSILNLDQMEADRKKILEMYGGDGYIYASVDITHSYAQAPATVNLHVKINEADTYKIGRIIIRGNKKTQDRVVRRTLDFYPTQTFDLNKMQKREQRLRETRLFKEVSIKPVPGDTTDERDALIQVEEADTTRIMAGVGVTSNSGLVGNLTLENWNFNIWDRPRSLGEFFRGQSFKGAGQTLRLSFEPGTEMTSFRIDFTEPYLCDLPISFGWSGYLFTRERDGYDENRVGTIFSLGKRFKDIYSVNNAFRFEGVKIDDIDKHLLFFAPEDILEVEGSSFLSSYKLSLARDTTDSIMQPTRGTRLVGSWEQAGVFGGEWTFSKIIAEATHYKTLRTDIYDRKTVWASNATVGYIAGDVPAFERFYGGGIGSIRGFEYRGISPRQWPSNTAVGGNSEILVGNEIEFPVVGKNLRGVTFLDMGTVDDDFAIESWRAAIGFGVRLTLDFFGPVPMAFDFAFPISKASEDDTQIFSFSLGATFK